MCSACSGDDPRPEMFTTFDISSPKMPPIFAIGEGARRKEYGTLSGLGDVVKPALTLANLHLGKLGWLAARRRINNRTGNVYLAWPFFSRLRGRWGGAAVLRKASKQFKNSRFSEGWGNRGGSVGAPIEVRVSEDALVEVYSMSGAPENNFWSEPTFSQLETESEYEMLNSQTREYGESARQTRAARDFGGSAWRETREARDESQRAFAKYSRARRVQRAAAYIAFAALAAIAMWFAMR